MRISSYWSVPRPIFTAWAIWVRQLVPGWAAVKREIGDGGVVLGVDPGVWQARCGVLAVAAAVGVTALTRVMRKAGRPWTTAWVYSAIFP